MTKPDFIIIGAMKSATSTLHTQLALQSGIFMSTPKEPNYFSDDAEYARGEYWYESLFASAKTGDLCGESSTHYTKLPDYPLTIARMAQRLQSPKLIYVMRHPVERLISHYIHQWSQNIMRCDINEAIDKYPELINYSCYALQLQAYFEQFGRDAILPLFTEAIQQAPQQQLQRIADFIGYQGQMHWHENIEAQNISSQRIRAFKGYDWLVESKMMTSLRRTLVPQTIRDKIKQQLTLQKRPQIDAAHLNKVIEIFDQDLAWLGINLGVELSCKNYQDVVKNQHLNWQTCL